MPPVTRHVTIHGTAQMLPEQCMRDPSLKRPMTY